MEKTAARDLTSEGFRGQISAPGLRLCLLHYLQRGEKWRGVVLAVYANGFNFCRDLERLKTSILAQQAGTDRVRFLRADPSGLLRLLSPVSCSRPEVVEFCRLVQSSQNAAAQLLSVWFLYIWPCGATLFPLFCLARTARAGRKEGRKNEVKAGCKRIRSL